MAGTATRETTSILGARAPRGAALLGTVSAIALAQVMGAAAAVAGAGPCSLDATTPGTYVYTCSGTIATSADNTSAVSYTVAAGSGVYTNPGSAGNNLTVDSAAEIVTAGAGSHGIAASSLAGNGGQGSNHLYWLPLPGGAGGAGGAVSVTNAGTIYTSGAGSHGIYATSTAGYRASSDSDTGAQGGAGGKGGAVAVSNSGTITTNGAGSHGISAVSTTTSFGYGSGAAGDITVTSSGDITTNGDASHGISAVSSRLTSYGQAAGPQGNVTVTSNGNVTTNGMYAVGIHTVGAVVTVNVNGNITNNGADSDAITASGNSSTVNISANANVISTGVVSAYATTTATINNSGFLRGGIALYGGTGGAFNNNSGAVFEPINDVILFGRTMNNAGTVSPGGTGTITNTYLGGSFVQTSTGVLKVDADWTGNGGAGSADKLQINGTATLAGTVIVNTINFPRTGGLTRTFTVVTADGGITNDGISIANTAAVNYALLFPDANTMNVQATINFQGVGLGGLTGNQGTVGGVLNKIIEGGTTLPFMPGLMTLPTTGQLGGALNQLSPIGDGAAFSTAMTTGNQFGQQLLSCRVAGEEGEANRFIREGQCIWARINARRLDNDGRADGVGYRENGMFYSAGAQLAVARDWRIGGGIGYETMNLSTHSSATSQGERLHLGGVVKYNPGPLLLAASVTGGWGWHDNRRHVAFGGFGATATSNSESSFVASRLTAAYLLSRGALYAKPQVELAATHLMRDSYRETGTGGIALAVGKVSDTVLSVSPSLELGVEQRSAGGFVTRAFVKGGATFRDTDTFVTTATFADAPGAPAFAISSKVDKTVADVGAGVDLISAGGSALRLQYDGQLGERTTQHSGGAKLQLRF